MLAGSICSFTTFLCNQPYGCVNEFRIVYLVIDGYMAFMTFRVSSYVDSKDLIISMFIALMASEEPG